MDGVHRLYSQQNLNIKMIPTTRVSVSCTGPKAPFHLKEKLVAHKAEKKEEKKTHLAKVHAHKESAVPKVQAKPLAF